MGIGKKDVPIKLGSVEINPGDWIYIDSNGWIISKKKLELYKTKNLFSTYYFFSRVINGFFKHVLKSQPKYDDFINKIGWCLPQKILTNYSRERLYLFKKKR